MMRTVWLFDTRWHKTWFVNPAIIAYYKILILQEIKIEEKEVAIRKYKTKIEMVQKLILAKRRIMYEVQDKLDKKVQTFPIGKLIETIIFRNKISKNLQRKQKDMLPQLVKTCLQKKRMCTGSGFENCLLPRDFFQKNNWGNESSSGLSEDVPATRSHGNFQN